MTVEMNVKVSKYCSQYNRPKVLWYISYFHLHVRVPTVHVHLHVDVKQ